MRLVCASCGNYVHFEVDVEMVRSIRSTAHGVAVENSLENGWDDSETTLRMGVIDVVDYCTKQDMDALRWEAESGCYINAYISCARCGSKRVCVPYQLWSPPKDHVILEEEIKLNRHEFQWLRKEREHHADTLPVLY